MAEFKPVLLRRILEKASPALDAYKADGGYRALQKAVSEMAPEQVTQAVVDSKLRGRGGAGFPCGVKWTFLPKGHPGPIYLCVNADESEPGTFNNRILMGDPHQLIEVRLPATQSSRTRLTCTTLRYGKAIAC
jgi:NADH-quinone oxidoreductase subunit F